MLKYLRKFGLVAGIFKTFPRLYHCQEHEMENFMQRIRKMLYRTTVYLTAVLTVFYLFSLIVQPENAAMKVGFFFLFFAFSAVLSAAEEIFYIRTLPVAARCGLHYLAFLISFILLYAFSGNYELRGSTGLFIATVLFSFAYGLVLAVFLLIRSKRNASKAKKRPSTYQRIYK